MSTHQSPMLGISNYDSTDSVPSIGRKKLESTNVLQRAMNNRPRSAIGLRNPSGNRVTLGTNTKKTKRPRSATTSAHHAQPSGYGQYKASNQPQRKKGQRPKSAISRMQSAGSYTNQHIDSRQIVSRRPASSYTRVNEYDKDQQIEDLMAEIQTLRGEGSGSVSRNRSGSSGCGKGILRRGNNKPRLQSARSRKSQQLNMTRSYDEVIRIANTLYLALLSVPGPQLVHQMAL